MTKDKAKHFLYMMQLVRDFEEACAVAYGEGYIGGFLHLATGEESVAVGAVQAMNENDYIITHYRDHGHALARGCEPKATMAELFGREEGLCRGRGGSMHLFNREKRFMGGYAIVGGHIPIAAGIAWGCQYQETEDIVLCTFGDGSTNIGMFHEALNLAGVWKLPILFVCENNGYAMGSKVESVSAITDIHEKAHAYGMPHKRVDGMHIEELMDEVKKAAKHVRSGKGPYFLEAMTYRFKGHSMGDPERYRTKEEVEEAKKRDCIEQFKDKCLKEKLLTKDDISKTIKDAQKTIDDAVEFAKNGTEPSIDSLYENIYSQPVGV